MNVLETVNFGWITTNQIPRKNATRAYEGIHAKFCIEINDNKS